MKGTSKCRLERNVWYSWLRSTVGGTPVFGRRTDSVLRSACSWRVTIIWVNRPLQVSQLGQLSLSSFRGRYIRSGLNYRTLCLVAPSAWQLVVDCVDCASAFDICQIKNYFTFLGLCLRAGLTSMPIMPWHAPTPGSGGPLGRHEFF